MMMVPPLLLVLVLVAIQVMVVLVVLVVALNDPVQGAAVVLLTK